MGEIGQHREPVPGLRAAGTRASVWRANLGQAVRLPPRGHLWPALLSLGSGAQNSLPEEHAHLCPRSPTSLGLLPHAA